MSKEANLFNLMRMQEMESDIKIMLLYSFRYCLGRKSYAVMECCKLIKKYHHCLDNSDKELIIKEIEKEHKIKALGLHCDERDWLEVLEFLRGRYEI